MVTVEKLDWPQAGEEDFRKAEEEIIAAVLAKVPSRRSGRAMTHAAVAMPDPIIERAARALSENLAAQAEKLGFVSSDAGRYPVLDGCFDMDEATRAVLRAIREPSEAMVRTGGSQCNNPDDFECDGDQAVATWQAMIDAALGEGR